MYYCRKGMKWKRMGSRQLVINLSITSLLKMCAHFSEFSEIQEISCIEKTGQDSTGTFPAPKERSHVLGLWSVGQRKEHLPAEGTCPPSCIREAINSNREELSGELHVGGTPANLPSHTGNRMLLQCSFILMKQTDDVYEAPPLSPFSLQKRAWGKHWNRLA